MDSPKADDLLAKIMAETEARKKAILETAEAREAQILAGTRSSPSAPSDRISRPPDELSGSRERIEGTRPTHADFLAADDDTNSSGPEPEVNIPLRFSDIAGLEEVKEEMRMRMLLPFENPDAAKRYNIKPGGGILMYGPPGTGKTMMARAAAGELGAALFARKASDLIRSLVGKSEEMIHALFAEARKCKRAIIYIDEIETLIPERGNLRNNFEKTVVTQFLTELEGFEGGGRNALLFMGTSNNPWDIDAAMMRPGRFDIRIYMGLPDLPARRHMLEMQFAKLPVSAEVDWSRWAVRMEGYSGADIRAFAERAGREALKAEMASGRPTPCGVAILERCLETVRPSVTQEHLAKYARWREKTG